MLSSRLKLLRVKKGMTQGDIATRLKMARTTYSGYENGSRDPDPDTLQKIADFHDVSVDFLLGRDSSKQFVLDDLRIEALRAFDKLDKESQEYIVGLMKKIGKD